MMRSVHPVFVLQQWWWTTNWVGLLRLLVWGLATFACFRLRTLVVTWTSRSGFSQSLTCLPVQDVEATWLVCTGLGRMCCSRSALMSRVDYLQNSSEEPCQQVYNPAKRQSKFHAESRMVSIWAWVLVTVPYSGPY